MIFWGAPCNNKPGDATSSRVYTGIYHLGFEAVKHSNDGQVSHEAMGLLPTITYACLVVLSPPTPCLFSYRIFSCAFKRVDNFGDVEAIVCMFQLPLLPSKEAQVFCFDTIQRSCLEMKR